MPRIRLAFDSLRIAVQNADIRRAELAWGAAVAAEWAHFVALGVFAYDHGGSTAVGIAGLMRLLPAAAIAPFATSLGDRFRRERFLVGVVLLGAAALLVSAWGATADDRNVVFGAACVVGVSSTLFRPALLALLPTLARTARELIAANGATSTIESLGTLLGPLCAGVLVALGDTTAVFAAGTAALLVSAVLLSRVSVQGRVRASTRSARAEVWLGFKVIGETPSARLLVGLIASQTFVRGCLNVLIVVTAFQVLDEGATEVGYLTAALGGGGLLGALGAVSLRSERLAPPFAWAIVCWGVPIMLLAPLPSPVAIVVLLAVIGAANSVVDVSGFTLLQRTVPDRVLTRALGVTWGLAMGTAALGSLVTPAVLSVLGLRATYLAVGAILPILVLVTRRRLIEIDSEVAPDPRLSLVERVGIFAPFSLVAKERIAALLAPVDVRAGDVVIREGDAGDRFYVVGDGSLTIGLRSRELSVGQGDFFGEIALLRDVPRTATVTAITDSRLYALEREDFLAAVTGHPKAHEDAHALATTRMGEG